MAPGQCAEPTLQVDAGTALALALCGRRGRLRGHSGTLARRLFRPQAAKLHCEGFRPTTVSQRMHIDPDPALPLIEFERPSPTRNAEVPMMATGSPRKFAVAAND